MNGFLFGAAIFFVSAGVVYFTGYTSLPGKSFGASPDPVGDAVNQVWIGLLLLVLGFVWNLFGRGEN